MRPNSGLSPPHDPQCSVQSGLAPKSIKTECGSHHGCGFTLLVVGPVLPPSAGLWYCNAVSRHLRLAPVYLS